jgi:predicted NUDIX family NTP pyrophosphohydrolase
MAAKKSAGLLMYRRLAGRLEVFLVHLGGPFWARKDAGAWSIPKGEYAEDEDPLAAARREFEEETGITPTGELAALAQVKQAGGKVVTAWAFEGDCDPSVIRSNSFSMEWPPGSGKMQSFPEVDRAAWFDIQAARARIHPAQTTFLDRLLACLEGHPPAVS